MDHTNIKFNAIDQQVEQDMRIEEYNDTRQHKENEHPKEEDNNLQFDEILGSFIATYQQEKQGVRIEVENDSRKHEENKHPKEEINELMKILGSFIKIENHNLVEAQKI